MPDEDGEYIRRMYRVPANVDTRVIANGRPGVIVGFTGAYLRVLLEGDTRFSLWHPTWEMEYLIDV